jgi:hypothetical protein
VQDIPLEALVALRLWFRFRLSGFSGGLFQLF